MHNLDTFAANYRWLVWIRQLSFAFLDLTFILSFLAYFMSPIFLSQNTNCLNLLMITALFIILQVLVSYIDLSIFQSTLKRLQTYRSYEKKVEVIVKNNVVSNSEYIFSTCGSSIRYETIKSKNQIDDISIIYEE